MWVVAAFGLMAFGLATLGTYALLSYEVSLREREIGIRLALGSQRSAILALLIGRKRDGSVGIRLRGCWERSSPDMYCERSSTMRRGVRLRC